MNAIYYLNPLDRSATLDLGAVKNGDSIRAILCRNFGADFDFMLPTIVVVNGVPVLRENWQEKILTGNCIVEFKAVLGYAYIPYALAALAFAVSVYTYLNMPDTPEQQNDAERVELIGGQRNVARIGDPIPVIYGTYRVYPDVAAITFSDFVGNDQYLYQLFCVGHGDFDIVEEPRIDDTLFSSFGGAEYAVYAPGQHQNMIFPTNVVTSPEVQQNEILGLNEWRYVSVFYSTGNDIVTFDAATKTIKSNNGGSNKKDSDLNLSKLSLQVGTQITVSGSASNDGTYTVASFIDGVITVDEPIVDETFATGVSSSVTIERADQGYSGWYVANAAGTQANKLKVDFGFLTGLLRIESDGDKNGVTATWDFEYQKIDDSGTPVASPVVVNLEKSAKTSDAIIVTHEQTVSAGRYQVRARKTSKKWFRENGQNTLSWMQSRAYITGSNNFGDVTMLAVILKSSGGVSSGGSNRVNLLVQRKTSAYNPATQLLDAATANNSIAWAALDVLMSSYGGNKTLSQIDVDALYLIDQQLQSRGDTIGIEIKQRKSMWSILQEICRLGRFKPVNNNGYITFIRDEQNVNPNLPLFTPANMLPDSYSETVTYKSGGSDDNDYLIVEYQDKDKDYKTNEVECSIPTSTKLKPKKLVLRGCVDRDQAYREGMYMLANQYYRRKRISFSTEMEGFLLNFGDHILVGHDIDFNQFGVIDSWDALTNTATVSELPAFATGTNYIAIRDKYGNSSGAILCYQGANSNEIILDTAPAYEPQSGDMYSFGLLTDIHSEYVVLGIEPDGDNTVKISAVIESQSVHTADGLASTPANYTDQNLDKVTAVPVINNVFATADDVNQILFVNWTSSAGAVNFEVEILVENTDQWQKVGFSKNNKMQYAYEQDAITEVRVRGWSDQIAGPWATTLVGLGGVAVLTTESGFYLTTESGEYLTTEAGTP